MQIDHNTTIGIVGTGMIASSMAVLASGHGFRTVVLARSQKSVDRCSGVVDGFYAQMVDKQIIDESRAAFCKSYIQYTFDYKDLKDSEIVFESVLETTEAKYEVYRSLEECCPQLRAICSVSSTSSAGIWTSFVSAGFGSYLLMSNSPFFCYQNTQMHQLHPKYL